MKSNLRNEIKSYIVRQGMTMQEVVDLLRDEHGWSDSVSNLSNKLQRESLRYVEAVQLADALGYEIVWQKRRYHHSTDDGKYLIMGNGTQAFAIAAEQREQENYMRTAELSTEQNYNMIDGQINNTPSVDELEEKAKRGEVISLSALAAAVKAEDGRTPQRDPDGKKPSIRAQLKADRAQSCKPQQREKEQEAKRSIRQALEME